MSVDPAASSAGSPLLRLEGVVKSFDTPGADAPPLPVLRGVDLELEPGESLAIVGPSGSGKSTLLNLIGTLEAPDAGRLLWKGDDLSALDEAGLAEHRNREVGFVFQHHHLLPQCSAIENVLLPTLARSGSSVSAEQRARAEELLRRVGLAERLDHRPAQLSGGERQRVAVVRALINEPALLLADEPTGSLDASSAAELGELLVQLNREDQLALVVVTHSQELANRMQRAVRLREGELTESAPTG
jgi:ABC-type lipoprotein export system ATPase subunit